MRRSPLMAAIVCGSVALALAGCGDSDDKSDLTKPGLGLSQSGDKSSSASSSSASPSGTPDPNTSMPFKHDPGQAGKVQDTLTSDGFQCTRSRDEANDLRMCAKAGVDRHDGTVPVAASVAFYSDKDGTVLLARIITTTILSSEESDTMKNQMLESILPADDAAIVEADGERLTWGRWIESQSRSTVGWLAAEGYDVVHLAPAVKQLPLTKEQALPKLKAAGLDCQFGDELNPGQEDKYLTCSDPGATDGGASIRVTDEGDGISGIRVTGSRGKVKNDLRAVKLVAPKLSALGDSEDLRDLADWIKSTADGRPHAAYVGLWSVSMDVVGEQSMLGDSVTVDATPEVLALGLSEDQQGGVGGQ